MQPVKNIKVPEELKKVPAWVCWRAIYSEKKDKYDKIPVNPKNGYNARSNDPGTWSDFETAVAGCEKYNCAGIGFMFGNSGYFGVDIDGCRDKDTGKISDMAKEIIKTLDSYTEISPSGTGIHIICKGKLPKGGRRNDKVGLEMYDSGRFFTITGCILDDAHTDVEERTEEIKQLHACYITKPEENPVPRPQLDGYITDSDLIKKAIASKNGDKFEQLLRGNWKGLYPSQSEADMAFCNMLAYWTGRDPSRMDSIFRQSGLYRKKWDERHGADTYGNITIQEAISKCSEVYTPGSTKKKAEKKPAAAEKAAEKPKYSLDDMGNAQRFVDQHGQDLHFSFTSNTWHIWNGKYWAADNTGEIRRRADETIKSMYDEAKNESDEDRHKALLRWIAKSRSANAKDNMIKEARHQPGIPILPEQMDSNIRLLNVKNGTLDLKTGELLPHRREDLITKMCPVEYDPDAKCERWNEFLNKIMDGKQELISFLQRAVGYSLTGSTVEQCLFIAYGSGANGKSTFLDTIQELLGEYAKSTSMNTFLAKQTEGISNDIARLVNARFVSTVEVDEGKKLSEALIKQLTGGDKITARFLRQEFFEFTPTFKIWMGTNHKPVIKGTDNGIWRRICLIPFAVTIPKEEQDKYLNRKLKNELSGILNWAVEGCIAWQASGLQAPEEVKAAVEDYRTEMDIIKAFLNECCVRKTGERLSSTTLYNVYKNWCTANGENELSQRKFSLKLKEKNIESSKSWGIIYWDDIELTKVGRQFQYGYSANDKDSSCKGYK